jgi:hypothetical protein
MDTPREWVSKRWETQILTGKTWVFNVWKTPEGIGFSMQCTPGSASYGATLKGSTRIGGLEYIKILNRVYQFYGFMTTEVERQCLGLWMFQCCKELMNKP